MSLLSLIPNPGPRRPMVLGNWKMHGDMVANEVLLDAVLEQGASVIQGDRVDVGVAVPAPYLFQVAVRLRGRDVFWGAQDVSDEPSGAFTGEVSIPMLLDFETHFVLIGHSERRARHAERSESINRKLHAAVAATMLPVLCVGESLEDRRAGRAKAAVLGQLAEALVGVDSDIIARCAIAYEPVWAIGTGVSASADDAQEMHATIRESLAAAYGKNEAHYTRLLYGGSVNPSNAASLFAMPDIDGALVGGASLKAADFVSIMQAADASAAEVTGTPH